MQIKLTLNTGEEIICDEHEKLTVLDRAILGCYSTASRATVGQYILLVKPEEWPENDKSAMAPLCKITGIEIHEEIHEKPRIPF